MSGRSRYANGHRRRELRRRVLAEEDVCWICGRPVDKSLPAGDPMAPELDEVVPVSLGGSPVDRANVRLAHRVCKNCGYYKGVQVIDMTEKQEKA